MGHGKLGKIIELLRFLLEPCQRVVGTVHFASAICDWRVTGPASIEADASCSTGSESIEVYCNEYLNEGVSFERKKYWYNDLLFVINALTRNRNEASSLFLINLIELVPTCTF